MWNMENVNVFYHLLGWTENIEYLILIDSHFNEPLSIIKSKESIYTVFI